MRKERVVDRDAERGQAPEAVQTGEPLSGWFCDRSYRREARRLRPTANGNGARCYLVRT